MQITVEYLTTLKQQAEAQRNRLLSEANQAVGAIAVIDALIAQMNRPDEKEPQP